MNTEKRDVEHLSVKQIKNHLSHGGLLVYMTECEWWFFFWNFTSSYSQLCLFPDLEAFWASDKMASQNLD